LSFHSAEADSVLFKPRLQVLLTYTTCTTDANEPQAMLVHNSPHGCPAQVEPVTHLLDREELLGDCVCRGPTCLAACYRIGSGNCPQGALLVRLRHGRH